MVSGPSTHGTTYPCDVIVHRLVIGITTDGVVVLLTVKIVP